ncbi:hypothetical protein D3C87_357790 [compost metagenome]
MKKTLLTIFAMSIGLLAQAQLVGGTVYQINGTDNVSPRTFATLRSAVTYVNANGLSGTGQAILEFSSGYTNEAMASPIVINALPSASATLGLTIRPATGVSINLTGNLAIGRPLIDLNNADYITLDGRPSGLGTTSAITLENTVRSSELNSVVRLYNDAQFNKLSYLTFKSAMGANISSAAVVLGTTNGNAGNTDNIINNNTFAVASTYVAGTVQGCQITSLGTRGKPNSNTQILNNNFEYWGGWGAIHTNDGSAWQINNNHFYNTFATQPLLADGINSFRAISLTDGTGGHIIEGNFFGGKAPSASGAKMEITALKMEIIYVGGNSTAAKTTIQNNTIANINVSTPVNDDVSFLGIICTSGSQIVDILNNTIGSVNTANSLVMNKNSRGASDYSMINAYNRGDITSNIKNNTLSNLQFNELAGTGENYFYGINVTGNGKIVDGNLISKLKISGFLSSVRMIVSGVESEIINNNIGSQGTINDIVIESTRQVDTYVVLASGDYATKITGNHIGGFSIKATLATAAILDFYGVYLTGSTTTATLKTIENNFIGGAVSNSMLTIPGGGAGTASINTYGIYSDGGIIRNNVIRNMTTHEAGLLSGIYLTGRSLGVVENNNIQNLSLNGQTYNSHVSGLWCAVTSPNAIADNTISGLRSSNVISFSNVTQKHVMGIYSTSSNILRGNRISNLDATGSGATLVYGIISVATSILKNRVYDLKSSNATAGASIGGMSLSQTASSSFIIANNVIHINHNGDIPVYGILSEHRLGGMDPSTPINAYYNTILLEGTASGSAISSIIYRTNNSPVDLKNNLLFNNRSGGSGIHSLYGATSTTPAWVSDYNFLATASGNTNVGNWSGMAQNFAAWKAARSGQDVNSINDMTLTPSTFFNMASATNFFLKTKEPGKLKIAEKGTPVSVTDDILGNARATLPSIGAFEEVVVLPVTFKDFTAKLNGNKVSLNWNVVGEIDILRYEVERMSNGTDFVKVATVGAGQLNSYSATDANPQLGSNYYRLSAINSDGTSSYFTEIKEVKVASLSESTVVVYPNPLVGNTINIAMAAYSNGIYTYKLSDITGRLLQKGSFEHRGSSNTLNLKAAISKGIYVLQISNGREQFQVKLIKP